MITEKKVLLIIAHNNFDDEEYNIIRTHLETNHIRVETASTHQSEAQGKYNSTVMPDVLINYVESGDYDGFVFVGEEAASEYSNNRDVLHMISQAHLTGKLLAAIGKAVPVLAYTGKLTGVLVAGDESEKTRLEELGAYFSGNMVEESNDFITASPVAATEFAEAIAMALSLERSGYLR